MPCGKIGDRVLDDEPLATHRYTMVAGNDAAGCHLDTPTRHPCGRPASDPVHDGLHIVSRAGGGAGGSVPDQIASTVTGAGSGGGSAYVTPRLIAGIAPLATRTCGHGKVTRYNLAVPGGYCRHDDGTECDPVTLMGITVSRDLLHSTPSDLYDQVRQAYADRVEDYVTRTSAAPARCAARWLVDDGPRLPLEYVCDEDAHPGSGHKWRAVPAVPAPARNGHYGVPFRVSCGDQHGPDDVCESCAPPAPVDQDAADAAAFDRGFMREHRRAVAVDRMTGVPLCEHGDDAAACQLEHRSPDYVVPRYIDPEGGSNNVAEGGSDA